MCTVQARFLRDRALVDWRGVPEIHRPSYYGRKLLRHFAFDSIDFQVRQTLCYGVFKATILQDRLRVPSLDALSLKLRPQSALNRFRIDTRKNHIRLFKKPSVNSSGPTGSALTNIGQGRNVMIEPIRV